MLRLLSHITFGERIICIKLYWQNRYRGVIMGCDKGSQADGGVSA